jgi:hypothetical protein
LICSLAYFCSSTSNIWNLSKLEIFWLPIWAPEERNVFYCASHTMHTIFMVNLCWWAWQWGVALCCGLLCKSCTLGTLLNMWLCHLKNSQVILCHTAQNHIGKALLSFLNQEELMVLNNPQQKKDQLQLHFSQILPCTLHKDRADPHPRGVKARAFFIFSYWKVWIMHSM